MGYYWLIPLVIGLILVIVAISLRASSVNHNRPTPSWFWVFFYAGIVFIFIAFIMGMAYSIEAEGTKGDYYRYHPQWYAESVDYPILKEPLPRANEVIQPVSDTCVSSCYIYKPPEVLVS